MRHAFALRILAAVALGAAGTLALAQERPGAAAGESYRLKARLVSADNCPVLCPCIFGDGPTYGHCFFVGAAIVDDGNLGAVSLKGVKFAAMGQFTGEVRDGPKFGFHAYYIDGAATAEQKDAMRRILSAAPWSEWGESLGIDEAPIALDVGKTPVDAWSFKIGEKGGFRAEPVKGGVDGQKPLVVENAYGTFPGQTAVILGKATGEFADHGKTLGPLTGNSGEFHFFDMNGSVPAKGAAK